MTEPVEALAAALADRYRLEREIGAGGMARVYLAHDLRHNRQVALKVLRRELGAMIGAERFLAEIRITAALTHPHILPLFESGEAAGRLFYVMPYVEGESLRERITRAGRLPPGEAMHLLREVADALSKAHRAGVIHRDLKPENILVADGHALVADFGVARAANSALTGGRKTTAGMAVGTPTYMAPEQAAADGELDHRADIYGFGVLAFEALTGRPPFQAANAQAVIAAHLTQPAPAVRSIAPDVPEPLARLVGRCLEKRPRDRPATMAAVASALDAMGMGMGTATLEAPAATPVRLRWTRIAAIGLGLVAVAAMAWLLLSP